MNNNSKTTVSGGIGFWGLLQVALIVLKLCGVIDWRWAVVLIPLWIDLGMTAVLLVVALVYYFYEKKIANKIARKDS